MRLIDTSTFEIVERFGAAIEPYVILSHTWEDEEVTFQDWQKPTRDSMKGFRKIRKTCEIGAAAGYRYAWVDTCCIDKTNSTELSEAINSMYKWYERAKVCYVFLSRFSGGADSAALKTHRWFSRGWTLQELVAPRVVWFFNGKWKRIGEKSKMVGMLSEITRISTDILSLKRHPHVIRVAERMSWAASRETTREEDLAYSLLGIFDVNMPMLYGEGNKAFLRLQQEIIKTTNDLSIFAWEGCPPWKAPVWSEKVCGVLAESPSQFILEGRASRNIPVPEHTTEGDISVTNVGIKLSCRLRLVWMPPRKVYSYVLMIASVASNTGRIYIGVVLKKINPSTFVRRELRLFVGTITFPTPVRYCPNAFILNDVETIGNFDRLSDLRFSWPPGVSIARCYPWTHWDDECNMFMSDPDRARGSFLINVQGNHPAVDFMFVFCGWPYSSSAACTVVDYGRHQMALDIINLRLEAGDMDEEAMLGAVKTSSIPRQNFAIAPAVGTDIGVCLSVEIVYERPPRYEFSVMTDRLDRLPQPEIFPWPVIGSSVRQSLINW